MQKCALRIYLSRSSYNSLAFGRRVVCLPRPSDSRLLRSATFCVMAALSPSGRGHVLVSAARCIHTTTRASSSRQHSVPSSESPLPAATSLPFSRARTGPFVQAEPLHENSFLGDAFLQRCLQRLLPSPVLAAVTPDLTRFGTRVCSDVWALGRECEVRAPSLASTTAWGRRVDNIITCEAWKEQKRVSAKEGLIAIAYEREYAEFSRIYQMVKLALYSPASGLHSCPLAMTDGAAKTIESNKINLPEAFQRLTSRDPSQFWTSGQWMTEKRGGSDVGQGTETIAVQSSEDPSKYLLYGYKWFSSATDSDMSLALARIASDEKGTVTSGTKGVSMFFLKTKRPDGSLNNIEVIKLKNKLGTRQVPTGELLLDGVEATLASAPGRGIASITNMLTITRLHNTASSVACARKIISLARDYATRRSAFGSSLDQHVLHMQTLSRMETETRGCMALFLDLARQLGLDDCGKIGEVDGMLLRLMMPVAKMYTAKKAVETVSEGLECFGGQGYIEDTGLPVMLRDAQVLPIWEGTSNILSLDVLRSVAKSNGEVLKAFKSRVSDIVKRASAHSELTSVATGVERAVGETLQLAAANPSLLEIASRDFTNSLAHIYIAALLLEHAVSPAASTSDVFTARHWAERDLSPVVTNFKAGVYKSQNLDVYKNYVYDGYNTANILPPTYIA